MSVNPDVVVLNKRARVLGTRALGREIADEIRERVAAADRALLVDFQGIAVASSPVLDEIACALRAVIADYPDRFVVLSHLNDDVRETLLLVLEARDMRLAALEDDKLELLGGRGHLEETLARAQELGSFTAAELAERLELKLPNLHHRLRELSDAGVLARVESPSGDRALLFETPRPDELAVV